MVNMKDIAIACNVSISTVSRALRNEGYVDKYVKEQICQKANEIGYVPNMNARNLKKHKNDTIGIIVPDIKNYFYSIVLEKLVHKLQENGYKILIMYSFEDENIEAENFKELLSTKVAGIIFTPISNNNEHVLSLAKKHNVPVLQLYRNAYPFLDSIVVDDAYGAFLATNRLIEKGYKKILLFTISVELSPERSFGYKEAYKANGKIYNPEYVIRLPFFEKSYEIIQEAIIKYSPDAIIAGTNNYGVEALRALKNLKLKLHKDVEVILFDDMDWYDAIGVSSIAQPIDKIENAITSRIIEIINKDKQSSSKINIEIKPSLIIR